MMKKKTNDREIATAFANYCMQILMLLSVHQKMHVKEYLNFEKNYKLPYS